MKSAEQWNEHGREVGWDSHLDSHVARAIQADALRHAAEMVYEDGNPMLAKKRILSAAQQLEPSKD